MAEKHVPYGVQQSVQRYSGGVAQTEVVITELNCIYCTNITAGNLCLRTSP